MRFFVIRRLLQAIPTLFGITLFSYLLMLAAPGDPLAMIGFNPDIEHEDIQRIRRMKGMDQPPLVQYIYWLFGNDWVHIDADGDGEGDMVDFNGDEELEPLMGTRKGLLRGDLGDSIQLKRPVWDLILSKVPATLELTLTSLLVGYLIGIPVGVYSAVKQGGWFDQWARVLAVVGNAVPGFWLALVLVLVFAVQLRWLPTGRRFAPGADPNDLWLRIKHLILPVTVLALGTIAGLSRIMRTEALEVLGQDYIRTARAKGLSNQQVWWGHAVRNALIPLATFFGPALGGLLGGAVITETIFSWPGMGRLTFSAVSQRDYPLVMGSVVIGAALYIFGLLLSDIMYAWVDPRIRLR